VIEFVEKNRERIVLLGVAAVFLFLVGGGIYLQKQKKEKIGSEPKVSPIKVEVKLSNKNGPKSKEAASPGKTSFYLKPSPDELLSQIASLDSQDESVANQKFSGLPVMWPVYFFSLQEDEQKNTTAQLDVSEDGFGVIIICDVDLLEYPEIAEIESGKKIWVAGEILAVDLSGTGTIYLKTEYFRFNDEEDDGESAITTDNQQKSD